MSFLNVATTSGATSESPAFAKPDLSTRPEPTEFLLQTFGTTTFFVT
jgi:hypothetical protein